MRRRQFIGLIGGAATALPAIALAQRAGQTRRVGMLLPMAETDAEGRNRAGAIRQGLEQLGWKVGANLRIDFRWANGDMQRLRSHAAELVTSKPDVLVASATNPLAALRRATSTIPIVFVQAIDPVGGGYVASLAHPGGNITGFAAYEFGLATKWLALIKQIAPSTNRVGVIHEPTSPQAPALLREIENASTALGLRVIPLAVRNQDEIGHSIESFAHEPNGSLILLTSPLTVALRHIIIALIARQRVPCIYPVRHFVVSGGLISYGINTQALYISAASYVDRILKGEKPGDLPVQQASKFELAINLKAAKALGLIVPDGLIALADDVIE